MVLTSMLETMATASGALAVARTHMQLAQSRVQRGDRLTQDHLDTARVFMDSAETVLQSIVSILRTIERAPAEWEQRRIQRVG